MTMKSMDVDSQGPSAVVEEKLMHQHAVAEQPAASRIFLRRLSQALVVGLACAGVVGVGLLSHKLRSIQEQLARQSTDATAHAVEARVAAKQAQELSMQTAAKLALLDARVSEVSLQSGQFEELVQSLARSRDENLVVDVESAVRLAQQQAEFTGSVEPLLAALKSAAQRLERAPQGHLIPVLRAVERDIVRVKETAVSDIPSLLMKLDELMLAIDDLPLANAAPLALTQRLFPRQPEGNALRWWEHWWQVMHKELTALVRVARIDNPEAVLLSPEQSFFLRENLKLRLLNARFGLLSRQTNLVRSDLAMAATALNLYFDGAARKTQAASSLLQQVRTQMGASELPRVDETLAALANAAAGR